MILVMDEFKQWCNLPSVQGTIDGTHISILKPQGGFASYYYYHKTWGYVTQVIVDCSKKIIDLLMGLFNDTKVLCKSSLDKNAQLHGLFDHDKIIQNGFPPYLLGDKGHPLISSIMTLFKEEGQHLVLEIQYNEKHKRGCSIVEFFFDIFKKKFQKLLTKSKSSISFILDVFICCCILHNLFRF